LIKQCQKYSYGLRLPRFYEPPCIVRHSSVNTGVANNDLRHFSHLTDTSNPLADLIYWQNKE